MPHINCKNHYISTRFTFYTLLGFQSLAFGELILRASKSVKSFNGISNVRCSTNAIIVVIENVAKYMKKRIKWVK